MCFTDFRTEKCPSGRHRRRAPVSRDDGHRGDRRRHGRCLFLEVRQWRRRVDGRRLRPSIWPALPEQDGFAKRCIFLVLRGDGAAAARSCHRRRAAVPRDDRYARRARQSRGRLFLAMRQWRGPIDERRMPPPARTADPCLLPVSSRRLFLVLRRALIARRHQRDHMAVPRRLVRRVDSKNRSRQVFCRTSPSEPPSARRRPPHKRAAASRFARAHHPRLRNSTDRLFAGISTMRASASPCAAAHSATVSSSRSPQRGSRRRRSASNASLLGTVGTPARR